MKTFISFSSKDEGFVSKFKARIIAQKLNLWDYSHEGEEIPGGVIISSYLGDRVTQAELFIPLVTPNSILSDYTQIEVKRALERYQGINDSLKIIPIVDMRMLNNDDWGKIYEKLKDIRFFSADFQDRKSWESVIAKICYTLNIEYHGLISDNTLLPFMNNFEEELKDSLVTKGERFDSIFRKLEEIRNRFVVTIDEQDYDNALTLVELFNNICEYEFSGHTFYFANLTKAVCLIGLGRFTEALEIAFAMEKHEKQNEIRKGFKETRLGIIGYIKQSQGFYAEAAQYYSAALNIDPTDPAAATGVVVNRTLSLDFNGIEKAMEVIEKGYYHTEQDRQRAQTARAFALAAQGKSYTAVRLFQELITDSPLDPEVYIHFSRALYDLNRCNEAGKILELGLKNCVEKIDIFKWKMNFHLEMRDYKAALLTMFNAVQHYPESHELEYFLQFCLVTENQHKEARNRAKKLLVTMSNPKNQDEFYYAGFANYILGNIERANYDFERSGRDPTEYYQI